VKLHSLVQDVYRVAAELIYSEYIEELVKTSIEQIESNLRQRFSDKEWHGLRDGDRNPSVDGSLRFI
jgi:hypothetical protein